MGSSQDWILRALRRCGKPVAFLVLLCLLLALAFLLVSAHSLGIALMIAAGVALGVFLLMTYRDRKRFGAEC